MVVAGFLLHSFEVTGHGGANGGLRPSASVRSIEGGSLGTDVRLAGVKIGTVTDLALDSQTYRASTEMTVTAAVPMIPEDSIAGVAREGALDGTFVEILPGGSLTAPADRGQITDAQSAVSVLQPLLQYVAGNDEGAAS
jgi:phospholipid/cholesterol/gamma-HCH transport system substrate-binding protein